MACFHPLTGYRKRNGKKIVFDQMEGFGPPIILPCGQCIGCRLERSRQWAVRMVHEAQLHDDNCFLTLTYNDENLPRDGSLNKKHFQDFMKRLRSRFSDRTIRFFHCGEYGELLARPHYHACVFGFDFCDKSYYADASDGSRLFTSDVLSTIWPFGFSSIGSVTFESAAYVARYVMKKVTGDLAEDHYSGKEPEYVTMSRRPGIGLKWYEKFEGDVFPFDEVVVRGHKCRPPRYYDDLYARAHGDDMLEKVKRKRVKRAKEFEDNNTRERLLVREKVKEAQVKMLKRSI